MGSGSQFAEAPPARVSVKAPIIIGLDADMSKGAAKGGEAIRRGVMLAINEINGSGGALGRRMKLIVRDHRGIPARGIDNIEAFASVQGLVAVVGGIHTPVALAQLDVIHKQKIVYLGPWAAGTPIVANGRRPNYVFRVSVRDQHAGGFLISAARRRGFTRPGLLLWRTGWGRSNEKAMKKALAKAGLRPAGVQWFYTGQKDIGEEIKALHAAGADVVMLVSNPLDGVAAIRAMAARPEAKRLPVISHWGITGGDFHRLAAKAIAKVDLTFLQTYSFFVPPFPAKSDRIYRAYCRSFGGCRSRADIFSPVGTAHAYDIVHLLKRAIERAKSTDRSRVRAAFERLGRYDGLVRIYDPPFTAKRHDALDASDFRLARFDRNGAIVPVKPQ